MPSLYVLLGVDPSAESSEIRAAYRKRLQELHPDRNPGFRDQATRACAELTEQFAAYSADPVGYRTASADPSPREPAAPESEGGEEIDDAISFAGSLVELLTPAPRLDAARRAVASGARIARRYVGRSTRG